MCRAELGAPGANSARVNLRNQDLNLLRGAKCRGLFLRWLTSPATPEILRRGCLIYGAMRAISQIFPSVRSPICKFNPKLAVLMSRQHWPECVCCSGWRDSCLELPFEQQVEKPAPAPRAVGPGVLVLGACELREQGVRAGVWSARRCHKVENCWSGQIPCLSELGGLVSVLPRCKSNVLSILRELLAGLPSPACCLTGQGDALLLLSSMRRSTLSALEHEQMLGDP